MQEESKLKKRPVLITANGRPAAYLGRFAPFRIVRWLRKIIWGERF
jgi:hypothetical protein